VWHSAVDNGTGSKFAAIVVDTGGKFATGTASTTQVAKLQVPVYRTGGRTLTCEFLREFSNKFKMILMLLSISREFSKKFKMILMLLSISPRIFGKI
jgi:hypothetical protein